MQSKSLTHISLIDAVPYDLPDTLPTHKLYQLNRLIVFFIEVSFLGKSQVQAVKTANYIRKAVDIYSLYLKCSKIDEKMKCFMMLVFQKTIKKIQLFVRLFLSKESKKIQTEFCEIYNDVLKNKVIKDSLLYKICYKK